MGYSAKEQDRILNSAKEKLLADRKKGTYFSDKASSLTRAEADVLLYEVERLQNELDYYKKIDEERKHKC